ncbi:MULTISPECIES: DUF4240 domain-containing protein [unclassified Streptosporangium]|uniref:DUF4240 domain-containing protein n=1 Tax=unclassified Streptosporangium TaxID=2632669 RepID=UPI002E2A607A|nr:MULTISPECIES: DUF4240 domain-containing protein [unclassified Streptosporangium]
MDIDEFWLFLQRSRKVTSNPDERLRWLSLHLAQRPPAKIADFQILLNQVRRRSDTYDMWEAADLIFGNCSTDGFWYFQAWLIGLGHDTFELAVTDPDNLAEVPEVQRLAERPMREWADDGWPEWEALSYVAAGAYEEVTGEEDGVYDAMEERGHTNQSNPEPTGLSWRLRDSEAVAQRLPRLSRVFQRDEL